MGTSSPSTTASRISGPGAGAGEPTRVLTRRELNRALLARQMLLDREPAGALRGVERLVAMQAQVVSPPFTGLWTRLRDFRREDLVGLATDRRVVRATLLRSTLHLISASDYLSLRTSLQPALDRSARSVAGRRVAGVDLERLLAAAREYFSEPRTFAGLRGTLADLEPGREVSALEYVVRSRLPLVQVPTGARWAYPGAPAYVLAREWLGREPSGAQDAASLIRRYLAAFGPATVADAQQWSGRTGMGEVFEGLRPELRTFRDERGRELFDLPEAPLPGAEAPAPARFVPDYDNLVISHADRTRVLPERHRKRVFLSAARVRATFLLDGFVRGAWRIEREGSRRATLVVEPFEPLSRGERDALAGEGEGLLRFAAAEAGAYETRFEAP